MCKYEEENAFFNLAFFKNYFNSPWHTPKTKFVVHSLDALLFAFYYIFCTFLKIFWTYRLILWIQIINWQVLTISTEKWQTIISSFFGKSHIVWYKQGISNDFIIILIILRTSLFILNIILKIIIVIICNISLPFWSDIIWIIFVISIFVLL